MWIAGMIPPQNPTLNLSCDIHSTTPSEAPPGQEQTAAPAQGSGGRAVGLASGHGVTAEGLVSSTLGLGCRT